MSQQEFKSDNVTINVEKLPKAKVKLAITVSPEATAAAYNKAVKTVNKEVILPGFRKGKAPDNLIIQKYASHVQKSWVDTILNVAFQEALDLTNITPYRREEISLKDLKGPSKEQGTSFTIEMETYPQVPRVDPAKLSIKDIQQPEVTDEAVNNAIENIRLHFANWKDLDDAAQEGKYIELDIENLDTNEAICQDARFLLQEGEMPKWMVELISGLKTGESAEGYSKEEKHHKMHEIHEEHKNNKHVHSEKCNHENCDADHSEEGDHFKPIHFRVTVKAVKEADLPGIDDELAKKTGLTDLNALKDRLRQDLSLQAEDQIRRILRHQIDQKLLENYDFDIPSSLVQYNKELTGHGEEQSDEEVENQLRLMFLLESIIKEQNLDVSDEEIFHEFRLQTLRGALDPRSLNENDIGNLQKRMRQYLLSVKAKDYLIEHANKLA